MDLIIFISHFTGPLSGIRTKTISEQEARFVTIDNFVKPLCELTDCQVLLEEKVKDGANINSGVSNTSRVDYCVAYLKSAQAVRLKQRQMKPSLIIQFVN